MATETQDTLADLLEELGGIPAWRVLRIPPLGTATEADVLRLAGQKRRCELVVGVLVEKVMGYREATLALLLGYYLLDHVRPRRLGVVAGADALMRLTPGLLRIPDVSFVTWARLPNPQAHLQPVADFAPDLAVEILSPGNTRTEMTRKRGEYFAAGTRVVWEVDPDARTVDVFTQPDQPTRLTENDALDGGAVLPGFRLELRELFNDPQLLARA